MDCPPQIIINGRTFVPVRFISEVLNATVDWNEEIQEIKITRW
ncbi:MAG: stalk domain-containing protein [Peptococcia bacterium]